MPLAHDARARLLQAAWSMISLCLALPPHAAENSPFIHEPDPPSPAFAPRAPWTEDLTRLPPLPQEPDLIELRLDGDPGPFRYFIDGRHLNVGTDGVVRYTVLIRARSGASNLSFEGIRCTARGQYRVFAYGADRGLVPVNEDWQPIGPDTEPYRIELWRHHLCLPGVFAPRSVAEIKRSLKISGDLGQGANLMPD